MYNETITIVNKVNIKGNITYYTHIIEGVHYQDKQGIRTGDLVQYTDNQGYVQIPHKVGGYLPHEEWLQLNDKKGKWTLNEGDFIIKGTKINETDVIKSVGIRTIDSFENIDYAMFIGNHYGVTLK